MKDVHFPNCCKLISQHQNRGVYPGKTRRSFLFTNNRHLACADRSYLMGVSGTVAQYLFQHRHFNTEWLTSVRLLVSGALLLGIAYRKEKGRIWAVWKDRRDRIPFFIRDFRNVRRSIHLLRGN